MGPFLEFVPIAALLIDDLYRVVNYNRQAKLLFPALEYLNQELARLFSKQETEQIKRIIQSERHP